MKQLLTIALAVAATISVRAATIGWSIARTDASYKGDAYQLFVVGQNNVTSIAAITALLDAGSDVSDYAFGSGTLTSNNGGVTVQAGSSGKSLGAGTYTSFFVIYDTASPSAGTSKYVVLSGAANQTRTIADTTASTSFQSGDMASTATNPDNWKSYGPVPEPTTVALLALGLAAIGLKRKVA